MDVKINKFEEELRRKDPRSSAYLDSMLARFNRGLAASGLFRELKEREYFVKPSTIRAKKKRNKLIKSRQQGREDAVHKKGVSGASRRGYRGSGQGSKTNKGQRPGRVFELHNNKNGE